MSEKLLNIDQIAKYLGLSRQKVKDLVDQGVIPAYRIAGSFLRFDLGEIDQRKERIMQAAKAPAARESVYQGKESATFGDRVKDFLYFNDFYIVCAVLVTIILVLISSY
jgi:excisionase family DNA binding protein